MHCVRRINRGCGEAVITKTFTIKYPAGHSYSEEWEATDLYCIECGEPGLWRETGPGDYDQGQSHVCDSCGAWFYTHGSQKLNANDPVEKQRIEYFQIVGMR